MEINKVKIFYCTECNRRFLDEDELTTCPACGSSIIAGIPRDTVQIILSEV